MKESKRISTIVNHYDYELLQNMYPKVSDGSLLSSFTGEMVNLIKIELDGLKIFTKSQIEELLSALQDKELSFNTVQPKFSLLYILKDYYKFEQKTKMNKEMLEKINNLSNLQVIILARFILAFTKNPDNGNKYDYNQAYHFFLSEGKENEIKITTQIISGVNKEVDFAEKLTSIIKQQMGRNKDEISNNKDKIDIAILNDACNGKEIDFDAISKSVTNIIKVESEGEADS